MLCDIHGDNSCVSNILVLLHGIWPSKYIDCWCHIPEDLKNKINVYLVRVCYITLSVLPPPLVLIHQNFIWCSSLKMCIKSCSSCRSSTLSHKASSPRQGRCRQQLQHIEPSVWRFCGEQVAVAPTLFGVYALTWQNSLEAFTMNSFASNWGPLLCLTQPRPGRRDTHTAFLLLNLFAGKLKIWNIHWDWYS